MNYSENVFQLDDPDGRYCFIESYGSTHQMLQIRSGRHDKGEYHVIWFRKVAYHSGPMTWRGANFRMFEDDAMFEFLAQRQFPEYWRQKHIALTFRLFQVPLGDDHDVIILANAAICRDKDGNTLAEAPRLK